MTSSAVEAPRGGTGALFVLVLFGGRSEEHGVSCLSAANVVAALEAAGHRITLVGITRDGRWSLTDRVPVATSGVPEVAGDGDTVALVPTRKGTRLMRFREGLGRDVDASSVPEAGGAMGVVEEVGPVDVCFPVLHGPYGEDGTVQGLLSSLGVPYVGSGVAASAVGIDKRQMKNVFMARGLPQVPYTSVRLTQWRENPQGVLDRLESALSYPIFTKPSRQGSSIGITKCRTREHLTAGMSEAFTYDRVTVVEQGLEGMRELECGVLGNVELRVAGPGEVITQHDFYDFTGKYLDEDNLQLRCPADVPDAVVTTCRSGARKAYHAIGARGMARVDFFYEERTGEVLVNEINTIPGFTSASMYPYVWSTQGLDGPQLVDELLSLALSASAVDGHYSP